MIISHKHKFIFIKTRKTAGTSVELLLGRFCGEDDVVTQIYDPDIDKFNHQPRNDQGFYNHIGAGQIRNMVGDDIWDNYFKFSIERNPWDKMVSMFWWRKFQYKLPESFHDFCHKALGLIDDNVYTVPNDYSLYTLDSKLAVNELFYYESLDSSLKSVFNKLGLGGDFLMPRAKSQHRKVKKHYSEYYDDKLRARVQMRFKDTIDLLSYSFQQKVHV